MGENPVKYMMGHEEMLLDAYQSSGGPKGAWELLQKDLPDLLEVMKYNTFKQYITPFAMIMAEVTQRFHRNKKANVELEQTIRRLRQEKNMLEGQIEAIQAGRLDKVPHPGQSEALPQGSHREIKNIQGWTVHKARDGYYRLHRKIKGRVHSIYLGQTLDRDKALHKIAAKQKKLLGKAAEQ